MFGKYAYIGFKRKLQMKSQYMKKHLVDFFLFSTKTTNIAQTGDISYGQLVDFEHRFNYFNPTHFRVTD